MRPHRHIPTAAILLISIWAIGLLWFIAQIPSDPAEDRESTDAIVVLTGGSLRLERGFELLAQGRAPRMFISGVEDGVTLNSLLKAKEYRSFATRIPASRVQLGYKARSTIGNAEEIAQWCHKEHVSRIRLVTGNYHMPRSIYELHQTVPTLTIIPEPVFPGHFEKNVWWQWSDSVKLVLSEYHKYLISGLRHILEGASTP